MCYLKQVNEQKLVPKDIKNAYLELKIYILKLTMFFFLEINYVKGNSNFIKCIYPQTDNYFL